MRSARLRICVSALTIQTRKRKWLTTSCRGTTIRELSSKETRKMVWLKSKEPCFQETTICLREKIKLINLSCLRCNRSVLVLLVAKEIQSGLIWLTRTLPISIRLPKSRKESPLNSNSVKEASKASILWIGLQSAIVSTDTRLKSNLIN